jgi:putative hydrolase of the HAD superfamily
MDLPRVIAFDGDDTLWHNERLFSMTQNRFTALLTRHVDIPSKVLHARLLETERRNLAALATESKASCSPWWRPPSR